MAQIRPDLEIPDHEFSFATSRSSGPGGQNVNKVETKVTLEFDLDASASLSEDQKRRIHTRLRNRINRDGVLQVVSQRHRTQAANREDAVERFSELLRDALHVPKKRKQRKVSAAARRRRLEGKKQRGQVKKLRRGVRRWED